MKRSDIIFIRENNFQFSHKRAVSSPITIIGYNKKKVERRKQLHKSIKNIIEIHIYIPTLTKKFMVTVSG